MGNDVLENKVDTNKNKDIEEKELLSFIGNQQNLEELGTYLNAAIPSKDRGDILYRTTQEHMEKYMPSIADKIKSDQQLTVDEQNIMKLQYFLERGRYPQSNDILNQYLGTKYNNQLYGSKFSFVKENSPVMTSQKENKELSEGERKLQIETILETGQYYIQFLQDKGLLQSQYQGDVPQHIMYYQELETKYANNENLKDADLLFYIHQIFHDISTSGVGYSSKAGAAYKEIDKILTSKQGWNKKEVGNKKIDLLYQIRQIDDTKGIYYTSTDMLLNTLTQNIGKCRVQRGPESWKLNTTLIQFAFLKPSEDGKFADPMVENMYRGFQHPSTRGDGDIILAFKKYKLPFDGASKEDMDDLQQKLQEEMAPIQQQEREQKGAIKKSILESKTQEIALQTQQKDILKKEFIQKKIDLTNPIAEQTLAYFDQQIMMNDKLIQGKAIEIETLEGGKKFITLDMIVSEQYETMELSLIADILQKGILYEVLQQNQKTTNFIQDMKKSGTRLTTDEKTIDMLADITGAGAYRSDKTFNTAVEVSKELVIQVALMAISGGIANIAAKGTLLAIQGGAKLFKAGGYVIRVANYTNMSKTAFWSSMKLMPELFAADIIAEGTIFHLANTTLNAPLQGLSTEEYFKTINPFGSYQEQQADGTVKDISNMKGYVESIAFMGVMKSFGSLTNQVTKALGGKTLTATQQSQTIKNILTANAITLPGEILAMQGTSAVIGLSFGHEVDLTPQSRAHTLALVIGLRIAHGATSPMKKASENIEGKIQENSMQQGTLEIQKVIYDKTGNVQAVEYRVVDSKGKEVDKGTASSATIDAAMKNKKAEETKLDETERQRIHALQEKSFTELTLKDREDMGGLNEWKSYIQKNELWKDESLSLDVEGKKNIDISNKQSIEGLTLMEFSTLIENIQVKKEKEMIIFLQGECREPIDGGVKMQIIPFVELRKKMGTNNLKEGTETEIYKKMIKDGFILGSGEQRIYDGEIRGGEEKVHLGIDYMVKGGTEVKAINEGSIVKIEKGDPHMKDGDHANGFGNMITLEHTLTNGQKFYSLYGHLSAAENIFKIGDRVTKGQTIGKVGESFKAENGNRPSHLHFEIKKDLNAQDGYGYKKDMERLIDPLKVFVQGDKMENIESNKNKLNISAKIQKQNSLNSDKLINPDKTINADAKSYLEQFLREQNVLGKDQVLSEAQIRKIYEVHNMQKKDGETEAQLNNRKGLVLKSLFTFDQIRALLEGKVCGVTETAPDKKNIIDFIGSIKTLKTKKTPREFDGQKWIEEIQKRNPDIDFTKLDFITNIAKGYEHPEFLLMKIRPIFDIKGFDYSIFKNNPELLAERNYEFNDNLSNIIEMKNKGILTDEMIVDMYNNYYKSSKTLKNILETTKDNKNERTKQINDFRDKINIEKGKVAETINKLLEKFDNDPNKELTEIIKDIYPEIKNLDGNVKLKIIEGIEKYREKIATIEEYVDKTEYKNNPAKLLCEMRGFDLSDLKNPEGITMKRDGASLVFDITNEFDFMAVAFGNTDIIYSGEKKGFSFYKIEGQELGGIGGRSIEESDIYELYGTLNIINKSVHDKIQNNDMVSLKNTKEHESQHTINKYIFNEEGGMISYKDETIAYMKNGFTFSEISQIILGSDLYNPNGNNFLGDKINKDVVRALKAADRLQKVGTPNLKELLAITPMKDWYKLEKTYKKETPTKQTNTESSKNLLNISPEIQEKNSLNSDKLIKDDKINADAQLSLEEFLRDQNVLGKDQTLSEKQIRKIYEVHTMQKKPGETNDVYLNIRKGFALRTLFTAEQIRALMEGNICGKNTREKIMAILEPIKNFLARGEVDLALSYVEKIAPSMEYVATEAPKKLVDIPRAFLDGYLRSKGVAEPSDLLVFFGDIKKLKDSIACSIQLYTENLGNINKLEETVANSKLPRDKRVNVGCKIIENVGNFKLSEIQREIMNKAIMKAHIYGHMETGKNGDPASIYNYTMHQLGNKMYILMDAMQKCGIDYQASKNIAKELLRKGICGEVVVEVKNEDIENKMGVERKENEGKRKEKEEIHSEVVKNTYDEIIKEITIDVEKGNNVEKNTYMLASMENLAKTSRTAQGILDASASENKKFKFEDISPEQGGTQALENFRKVSEYLYENKSKQFTSPKELQEFIENIAKDVNAGILKPEYFIRDENPSLDANGKPKYAYTEVNDLNIAFKDFCNSFLEKLNNPNTDPIELAAWVEYRVNIKDHFFADGCGKISIALSNFVLMRYGKELPDIRSKDERFEFTGKTQRNAKDPNNEPDLENRTNYYKTLFTMKEINKLSDIKAIEEYIKNPDNNKNLPTGKEIIIGAKDKKYIIVTKEGNLGIKTIENYVMDKINDIKDMQEVDKFIEKYNKTNPSKSKEMILGRKDGYCIIRNDKNGEIKRIKINESNVEKPVDFTKMSGQEILEHAIENTDLIIQKYQESQKIGEEFVVDVDGFRKFLGANEKVDVQLTHEGASYLADYYIDRIMENNKELIGKNITIRFIGGGAGSGKSLVSKFSPNEEYNGVWDGTMKTYNNAKAKIDKAIENGYKVQMDFVFRNMNDAWNNGVLKRTIEQNLGTRITNIQDIIDGKYDDVLGKINYVGRTLPLSAFKAGHLGARATFAKLYVEGYHKNMRFYSGDGKIDFNDFIDLHKNDIFNDDIAKQNVELIFKKGFISEQQYFELLGIDKK